MSFFGGSVFFFEKRHTLLCLFVEVVSFFLRKDSTSVEVVSFLVEVVSFF